MRCYCKSTLVCLSVFAFLIAAGCGGDADDPATSIKGPGAKSALPEDNGSSSTPKAPTDPLHPVVLIDTSHGKITVKLDAELAPLTVDNFLSYVKDGHYDQTIFHQVFKGQGIIGGGYTEDRKEKKTAGTVRNEADNGLKNERGTIAMARQPDAMDSATCQFFFNLSDNPELDHKDRTLSGYGYCVFGKVTDGLDVIDKIGKVEVHHVDPFEQIPVETVTIKSIRCIQ